MSAEISLIESIRTKVVENKGVSADGAWAATRLILAESIDGYPFGLADEILTKIGTVFALRVRAFRVPGDKESYLREATKIARSLPEDPDVESLLILLRDAVNTHITPSFRQMPRFTIYPQPREI